MTKCPKCNSIKVIYAKENNIEQKGNKYECLLCGNIWINEDEERKSINSKVGVSKYHILNIF